MIAINKTNSGLSKRNFDYEEDNYDRLKNSNRNSNKRSGFTSKISIKKKEFDYEEDSYEPEKNR